MIATDEKISHSEVNFTILAENLNEIECFVSFAIMYVFNMVYSRHNEHIAGRNTII